MVKSTNSQQVENEKTNEISQQVENDTTSSSIDKIVSLEIIPAVTHDSDHVADQDTDIDEDQGQTMDDVLEFITVGRARRNSRKPVGSLQI